MELARKTWASVAAAPPKCCATPEPAAPETAPPGLPLPAVMNGTPRPAPMLAAVSTAVDGTERQKDGPVRPSIQERLPQVVLEAVLGLLDRETLCTARLVSKVFCAAASANICSLTCRITGEGVSRQRFPRLSHVTVEHREEDEPLGQVATGLRDLITTLKIESAGCEGFGLQTLAQIALMRNLRELELYVGVDELDGIASLLRECPNLEFIHMAGYQCSLGVATTIATMASLKRLSIGPVCQPARQFQDRHFEESWLQEATALRNLQDLCICTTSKALPLIANLTGLTGLTWYCDNNGGAPYSIRPLTRLTKLRCLRIRSDIAERNLEIACSLGAGSLVSLSLSTARHADTGDCVRFLARQTALRRLTLRWGSMCSLQYVGALRIDLLESLELGQLSHVDAEGLSALRKATSLTSLLISVHPDPNGNLENDTDWEEEQGNRILGLVETDWEEGGGMGPSEHWLNTLRLSQAIGGLTRLRSLQLVVCTGGYPQTPPFMDYAQAVGPLTGLTQLYIHAAGLKDGDLRALLGLTGLRELDVSRSRLTNAVVPELSVLTNLKKLRLISGRVTSVAPLTEVLDPIRHARGWPPLEWSFEVEE